MTDRGVWSMNKDYEPISCEIYSRYELAIMRGHSLRVHWVDGRGLHRLENLTPIDLRTRNHAEFMIALTLAGHRHVLRLDRIRDAVVMD
jgi:Rho-binding antiterminator